MPVGEQSFDRLQYSAVQLKPGIASALFSFPACRLTTHWATSSNESGNTKLSPAIPFWVDRTIALIESRGTPGHPAGKKVN